jgi:RND superfamily putative drug exporter
VVKRTDGAPLTASDQAKVGELGQRIQSANIDRVTDVATGPQMLSPNKKVQLVSVGVKGLPDDKKTLDAVKKIRETAKPAVSGTPLALAVTGDIAMQLDNQDAFNNALAIIGIATVLLIITLLLLIYRSPIAALLPIVTVGIVTAISPGLIALVAKATNLHADPSLQIILTIVLFGVGTDYILFLLFRYRERLRAGEAPKEALANAVARVGEVIASAAGAIIIAFCALLLAVFGAFKSLGPGLAIAVAVMALAAVTLIPAVVSLLGPKVFWPSKSWRWSHSSRAG